jgi:hypothetical protein
MTATPSPNGFSRKDFFRFAGLAGGAAVAGAGLSALPASAAVPRRPAGASATRAAGSRMAAAAPGAAAATGGPILSSSKFPIGLFWPPPPLQTTVERYREIADAGFTFVHGGNYTYADWQISTWMLKVAAQAGIQVLVDDADMRWLTHQFAISDDGGSFTLSTDEARQKVNEIVGRYTPWWQIDDGRLYVSRGTGNGSIGSVTAGSGWRDYTLAFDTQPLPTGAGGYAQAGWAFRMQDEQNAYVWLLSTQGHDGNAVLKKVTFVGGGVAALVEVPLPYQLQPGQTYHVQTVVSGSTFTTSIDGEVVDTTTDGTYATGTIGFREAGGESAYFDNVVVTAPGGSRLFADAFSGTLNAWTLPAGSGYPSFAGLEVYDEPGVGKLDDLATVVDLVNAAYPDQLAFVNLLPGFGDGYQAAAQKLNTPVISFDRYPILSDGRTDTGYFANWAQVRAAALAHGLRSWTYIQSVGYNGHDVPTRADLLWQIHVSLAFGCTGIQYFTYWTPDPARGEGFHDGLITVDGRKTPVYAAARQGTAKYVAPRGAEMLGLTSAGVQASGVSSPPSGLDPFQPDAYLAAVDGSGVVLGRFTDGQGRALALVVNYSRTDAGQVRLTFGNAVHDVEVFRPADSTWVAGGGTLNLQQGAATLVRMS